MADRLPRLDTDPDHWGPDHLELVAEVLDDDTIAALVAEGNRQGREIDPTDDQDNGLT